MRENNNYGLAIISWVLLLLTSISLIKISTLEKFVKDNAYMQVGGKEVYYNEFKKLMDAPEYQESQKMNIQNALNQLEQIRAQKAQGTQPNVLPQAHTQPTVQPETQPTVQPNVNTPVENGNEAVNPTPTNS